MVRPVDLLSDKHTEDTVMQLTPTQLEKLAFRRRKKWEKCWDDVK